MNIKKKNVLIYSISNLILAFIVCFVSFKIYRIDYTESIETVASFNGTIYAGNQNSNKVTLMINVYWGDEHLESMLDTLNEYNMKTTFFLGGNWVLESESLAKKIVSLGHEIGSHATTHASLGNLDFNQNYKEIKTCHDIVSKSLNIEMNLLAPPSGSYNKHTTTAATSLGYKTIMWTRDTIDWRDRDVNIIYSRAVNNMQGGDLILMHPTKETAQALPKILDFIKNHGFILTTVSDNLS